MSALDRPSRSNATLLGVALLSGLAGGVGPLAAQTPPCRPCAGVVAADPAALLPSLQAAPALKGEARLYVAWPAVLDGSADPGVAGAVAATGATPWLRLVFRTAAPLTGNLEALEAELAAASSLAAGAGERAHFQILWEPAAGAVTAADYAFLLKRATAAVAGAQPEARMISQALPRDAFIERAIELTAESGAPAEATPAAAQGAALEAPPSETPGAVATASFIEALYAEEVAAYLDGVALEPAPAGELRRAMDLLARLDPGKPVVVDALPFPAPASDVLAEAARLAEAGAALTFFEVADPAATDLGPLKLLAREFQGDLAYDPYSTPGGVPGGELEAWSFVRGEDLGLRVVVRPAAPADEVVVVFSDSQLKRPARVDPTTGETFDLYGTRRTPRGLELTVADPGPLLVLRLERLTAEEIEGIEGLEEELTVLDERQMPVEEVLRRLQAFEDAQRRRLRTYRAINTSHLRFQLGTGAQSLEITFRGDFFFRQGDGFDWVWRDFLVNGVRWRGKRIPEIPLIQPEKAAALPAEITFGREYRYRLRGTAEVEGRDCWVVDFEPAVAVEPGRTLYQGTVWVDRQIYARVRTRAVQLGLSGEVISTEETLTFAPLDAAGQPAAWEPASFFLPVRLVGQQIWSVLSATTVVEREVAVSEVMINPEDFESRRQELLASDATMLRDTERGLRYLVKDEETGERVVQEEIDRSRRFLVGGTFYDESQDFPIPLVGFNWLWFDLKGTGTQANVFFAGPLFNVAVTDPHFLGSKFDAGLDVFALALAGTDQVFRDGLEVDAEEVEVRRPNVDFKLGRPLGQFVKLELQYELGWVDFDRADDTAEEFVVPADHLNHELSLTARYNRSGYRLRARGAYNLRSDWDPWGLPGNPDFDPDDDSYLQWGAGFGKVWHLKKFRKVGAEIEYVDGSRLDRFSKYEFGFFSDVRVHGYQSDKVRAEEAWATHLSYGFDVGDLFRLDLVGDAAWATDRASGLEDELLAGAGVVGTVIGPWRTVVNVDLGVALAGPDDGFSVFLAFLKLFR